MTGGLCCCCFFTLHSTASEFSIHCKNELVKVVTPAADGSNVQYKLPQESLPGSDLHYFIFTVQYDAEVRVVT